MVTTAAHRFSINVEPSRKSALTNHLIELADDLRVRQRRRFVGVDESLDHRNLDEVMETASTAENIAKFFYDRFKPLFPMLSMVRVSETPKTWAEYFETPPSV